MACEHYIHSTTDLIRHRERVLSSISSYVGAMRKIDPAGILPIQRKFDNEVHRRFNKFARKVRQRVVEILATGRMSTPVTEYQNSLITVNPELVEQFRRWLQTQVDAGILELSQYKSISSTLPGFGQQHWLGTFVYSSYQKGIARARQELLGAGYPVPSLAKTGGLLAAFNMPIHLRPAQLIFASVFTRLQGVTDDMVRAIVDSLTLSLIEGRGAEEAARRIVKAITGLGDFSLTDARGRHMSALQRARILARTETMRAHHMAMMQEYKFWEVAGVYLLAEFATAGDDRVCSMCASLEGKVYTLDEIAGMIPVHPQCRCVALPVRESRGAGG